MKNTILKMENDIATLADSKGREFFVDETDLEIIGNHRWCVFNNNGKLYVTTKTKTLQGFKTTHLHRFLTSAIDLEVDHIDGNGLNNQRRNLRLCTHSENMHNRKIDVRSSTRIKGLMWIEKRQSWFAQVRINNKRFNKYFKDKQAAIDWLEKTRKELHGSFHNHG